MKTKKLLLAAALAFMAGATQTAGAGTNTGSLTVQVTIVNSCTLSMATMNFGASVSDLTPAINATDSTSTVTCTGNSPVTISFNAGTGTGATFAVRKMTNGANTINYSLYKDAAHTQVLGDGSGSTVTIGVTPTGGSAADAFTFYGQTVAGQNPKPNGTYTDTVTATVTF
jgi:spore coat protein U-like protein